MLQTQTTKGPYYENWVQEKVYPYYSSLPTRETTEFQYLIETKTKEYTEPLIAQQQSFGKEEKHAQYVKVILYYKGKKDSY